MSDPYYSDDRATLYKGDALAILASLPTGSVDAIITDPPYSSGGMMRGDRAQPAAHRKYVGNVTDAGILPEFTGDSRDQRAFLTWMNLWLFEARRVVRDGGLLLSFTDWRQLPTMTDAVQVGGFIWRGIVPWFKPSVRPQVGRFTAHCEYVVWASNGALPVDYNRPTFPGFYQANAPRDREHITQKPVDVMRQLVKIVPEGGVVLDPFMGSGTTGVAAIIERRKFIGVEMVDEFARVSERRIREARGQAVARGEQDALDLTGGAS